MDPRGWFMVRDHPQQWPRPGSRSPATSGPGTRPTRTLWTSSSTTSLATVASSSPSVVLLLVLPTSTPSIAVLLPTSTPFITGLLPIPTSITSSKTTYQMLVTIAINSITTASDIVVVPIHGENFNIQIWNKNAGV